MGYKVNDAEHQDFIIDLGEEKEVSGYAIHGWCINDYAWLIWNLRHYSVSYLDGNGDWQTLVDTEDRLPVRMTPLPATPGKEISRLLSPPARSNFPSAAGAQACSSASLKCSARRVVANLTSPDTYDNKALNRPFHQIREPYSENGSILYPDTGDSRLTDGKTGGDSYGDAGWVGFAGQDNEKLVQVDLGKPYDIDKVEFSYCVDSGAGINPPSSTKVTYSLDGVTFTILSPSRISARLPALTQFPSKEPVVARYVRYNFTKSGSWLFVSEVAAYGTTANLDPKVPYLAQNLPAEKQLYFGNDAELTVSILSAPRHRYI